MTFLVLLIITGFSFALLHSTSIARRAIKEAEQTAAELKKLRQQYEELSDAYRDALESLRDCQQEDPCDPEYR